ncbi:hypothetical protein ASD06_12600 [Angustibacter sp. Root456]|nr:hypothetical protein ASD06_12600 [Angustibacter sp. Root456]
MSSPATGGLRALRAALLATACVSLALAAHTCAGGHAPDALAVLTATVAVGCAALLVTGRRLGAATTVVGLVGVQAALHGWFALTSGQGCAVTGAFTHLHGAAPGCPPVAGGAPEQSAVHGAASAGLVMLLAHLGAVVLLGLLLARGDALLWRLAGLLPRRLPAVVDLVALVPWRLAVEAPATLPVGQPVATGWHRRGPPRAAAAR